MQQLIQNGKEKTYKLLRWSEKWTKTDMVYLAKGGFWLVSGQVILAIASFLLAIAFANLLPQQTYGNYKYILSIAGLLSVFALTGMGTAIVEAVSKGNEGNFIKGFKENLKWSLMSSIVSLVGSIYYFINDNNTISISLLVIAVLLPLTGSLRLYRNFLNGKKEFKISTIYAATQEILSMSAIFITILLTKNILIIITIFLTSQVILNFFFHSLTVKKYTPNQEVDKKSIRYGKQLSIVNALSIISQYIDKIIIFHFLGSAQLAIYTFAMVIPDRVKSVLRSVNNLALPKFSNTPISELKNTLPKKLFLMSFIVLLIMITYAIVAPFIFKIVFPQYMESVIYSQLASLVMIGSVTAVLGSTLFANQEIKYTTILNIVSPATKISLFLFLGFFWGVLGIIIAQILFQWLNLLYYYVAFKLLSIEKI